MEPTEAKKINTNHVIFQKITENQIARDNYDKEVKAKIQAKKQKKPDILVYAPPHRKKNLMPENNVNKNVALKESLEINHNTTKDKEKHHSECRNDNDREKTNLSFEMNHNTTKDKEKHHSECRNDNDRDKTNFAYTPLHRKNNLMPENNGNKNVALKESFEMNHNTTKDKEKHHSECRNDDDRDKTNLAYAPLHRKKNLMLENNGNKNVALKESFEINHNTTKDKEKHHSECRNDNDRDKTNFAYAPLHRKKNLMLENNGNKNVALKESFEMNHNTTKDKEKHHSECRNDNDGDKTNLAYTPPHRKKNLMLENNGNKNVAPKESFEMNHNTTKDKEKHHSECRDDNDRDKTAFFKEKAATTNSCVKENNKNSYNNSYVKHKNRISPNSDVPKKNVFKQINNKLMQELGQITLKNSMLKINDYLNNDNDVIYTNRPIVHENNGSVSEEHYFEQENISEIHERQVMLDNNHDVRQEDDKKCAFNESSKFESRIFYLSAENSESQEDIEDNTIHIPVQATDIKETGNLI
ncbi:hypothetical protein GQR58_014369 [Nymphon striatum]|nr:hypothetical protein GQR58_014369 [Nymphon striatum]